MARKRKKRITKTEAVRRALEKFPESGPTDLAAKLKGQGVRISPAYVSTVKTNLQKKAAKTSKSSPRTGRGRQNGSAPNGYVAIPALEQAQVLIEKAGGVDKAKEALAVIAKLSH